MKRKLHFPIFLECCLYTPDHFWQHVFEDLAYRICPTGTFFQKDFFCCHMKQQEFSYRVFNQGVPVSDAQTLFKDISELLRHRRGLLQEKEILLQKQHALETQEKWLDDWHAPQSTEANTGLRRRIFRDHFFEKMIMQCHDQFHIRMQFCRRLLSFLILSFMFKTLQIKDIHPTFTKDLLKQTTFLFPSESMMVNELHHLCDQRTLCIVPLQSHLCDMPPSTTSESIMYLPTPCETMVILTPTSLSVQHLWNKMIHELLSD